FRALVYFGHVDGAPVEVELLLRALSQAHLYRTGELERLRHFVHAIATVHSNQTPARPKLLTRKRTLFDLNAGRNGCIDRPFTVHPDVEDEQPWRRVGKHQLDLTALISSNRGDIRVSVLECRVDLRTCGHREQRTSEHRTCEHNQCSSNVLIHLRSFRHLE